jgi:hypothetical protein
LASFLLLIAKSIPSSVDILFFYNYFSFRLDMEFRKVCPWN